MELLRIEDVSKTIKKKIIVDKLNMTVNSGEIVGFLGPNGAGKTTTIKMIMGLFSITSGTISVCGYDVKTNFEEAMMNVGAIVENPDLYKNLSGYDNLKYFAGFYGKESINNIDSVVEMVKMRDRIHDKVKTYSLGMRQRVGLAQSILHMPKLLVLDEPTNGLDPLGIKEMRDLLKHLAEESGAGILVSSHLLSEMELLCDRIYIIDNGVIIGEKEIGAKADSREEVFKYTFITGNNEFVFDTFKELQLECEINEEGVVLFATYKQISKFVKHFVEKNIAIYAVNKQTRTLEQDFISMTVGSKQQIS